MTSSRLAQAIAAAVALLAATETGMAVEPADIQGSWRLATIEGQGIGDGADAPRFAIENGVISGYDGCNHFSGPLDNPQAIVSTQRACMDPVGLPLDLTDPRAHLAEARLDDDGRLVLPAWRGHAAATFEREE